MKYMGSKNRIAKDILPIIQKDRKPGQWYVEPFVGGCNLIDKVDGDRLASDFNQYLIDMWQALIRGWVPPDYVDEATHAAVKQNPENFDSHFVAFVRLGCSFGADWNGGFARNIKRDAPNAEELNRGVKSYCRQSKNNILKQLPFLKGVIFESKSFDRLYIPDNSLIYCDPPYEGTTGYKDGFSHSYFWEWVRKKSQTGHTVFISEYSAPEDFDCIWQKEIPNTLNLNTRATERLFTYSHSDLF